MGYLALIITIILFSTIEVFSKMITGNLDPFLLAFIRFFTIGILIILIKYKRVVSLSKKELFKLFRLGIIGITIALGAFHLSIKELEASVSAVIFCINPIFAALYAILILGEKFHINKVVGSIVSFIGVYIISFGFNLFNLNNIKSVFLMLIAAAAFGIYTSLSKEMIKKHGAIMVTGMSFIFGSLPYLFFIKNYKIEDLRTSIPIIIYLTFITTGFAYILFFYGLKRVNIIIGSSIFYLKPVIATFFAIFMIKENPRESFYIGLLIVLIGMFITMLKIGEAKRFKFINN